MKAADGDDACPLDEQDEYNLSFTLDHEREKEDSERFDEDEWVEVTQEDLDVETFSFCRLNQDITAISVSCSSAIGIFQCSPFSNCLRLSESAHIVEMLNSTSLIALSGNGKDAQFSSRCIKLMNASTQQIVCLLKFPTVVLNIRMTLSRLIAVTSTHISIFDINSLKKLHTIPVTNTLGVCAVVQTPSFTTMAFPGKERGSIVVYDGENLKVLCTIKAHNHNAVSCIEFSRDGTKVASCSTKGTVIKIFSTFDGSLIVKLRRGVQPATITSLSFDESCDKVLVASDRDTIHIFDVSESSPAKTFKAKGRNHLKNLMPSAVNNLVEPRRTSVFIKTKEFSSCRRLIASFAGNHRIFVISELGHFYDYEFDSTQMTTKLVSQHRMCLS